MRPPDDDAGEFARLRFQRGQIANATFIRSAGVIDYQNIAGACVSHRFEKNINAPEMFYRQGATCQSRSRDNWTNSGGRNADRKLATQRGIGDQRRRKFGKPFSDSAIIQCADSLSKIDN